MNKETDVKECQAEYVTSREAGWSHESPAGQSKVPGHDERELLKMIQGDRIRLPFPTHSLKLFSGETVEEYEIPEEARDGVLDRMYVFSDKPSLDERLLDIHENKIFQVKDFRVVRQDGYNFLVSPYYPASGGTVLDWVPIEDADAESMQEDGVISIRIKKVK